MAEEAEFIDRFEAQDYLRLPSQRALRNLRARGLPYYRLGGRTLYKRAELEQFVAAGRVVRGRAS